MVKLEYSQIVRRKLRKLKADLTQSYGENSAKNVICKITKQLRRLETFPLSGAEISSQYDLKCDYRYIFAEHNYFFYRLKDPNTILILEMFHEKEDFMRKLFGITTTSQETLEYWDE